MAAAVLRRRRVYSPPTVHILRYFYKEIEAFSLINGVVKAKVMA